MQTRGEIADLQDDLKTTTVYVTHDQTEAMTLGDRVAVLRKGVVQQVAPPKELYLQPGEHLRRRLHRVAGDELLPRVGQRRQVSCRWASYRAARRR